MFSNNMTRFLLHLVKQGQIELNLEDEIIRATLVARDGDVVHARIRELLGLPSNTAGAIVSP
jgi:NAD(P) transhydrogenase subunit alpha